MNNIIPKVYITGDKHGEIDIKSINTKNWPEQKELTKNDYLIVLGDFGVLWNNVEDGRERYLKKWYNDKKCTTLFIDGNHENAIRLQALERVEMFGGTVGKVSDSIYHLRRGEVYTIAGKKFFTFGGALSVDKENRVEHISWWKDEIPNYSECEYGLTNLEKHGNKVDYILAHTCPYELMHTITYGDMWLGTKFKDPTTRYLDKIINLVEYESFHFGHFHQDREMGKFHVYYHDVRRLV